MEPLALLCAVEFEARHIVSRLDRAVRLNVGGRHGMRGEINGREILILPAGMGKTNAAQGLTAVLERFSVSGVIGFGVGGAYMGSRLELEGVALASSQHYGDEGVDTPNGWLSCEGIGIPLLETPDDRFFNDFPVDPGALAIATGLLVDAVSGPFVTVSTCSGTLARGEILAKRYGAICETMEGAAFAHVAAHYSVPYLEIRGISNRVEDRDLSAWRLAPAAAACAEAVAAVAGVWHPRPNMTRSLH